MKWTPGNLEVVLPVASAFLSFAIYWITIQSEQVKALFYSGRTEDQGSVRHIVFSKLFGFLIMGLVPLILCSVFLPGQSFGLAIKPDQLATSLLWVGALSVFIIPMTYFSSKKPGNLLHYPQIRAKQWTMNTVFMYLSGWAIYLFGYELLFRGIFLFPLVEQLGVWPAITINTALYSAIHLLNSPKESIGSIPFGIVLCLITIQTEMIWAAFLIHLCLSWTNAITSITHHPDIRIIRKK